MRSSKQSYARGHRAKSKQQDNSKELDRYYSGVFGSRWPTLREALLRPTIHAAVANGFILPASSAACSDAGLLPLLTLGNLHAFQRAKSSGPYTPPPLHATSALRTWYWLDLASILPVLLLQPLRGHAALDMCAAPGGKSALIAQRLFGPPAPPMLVPVPAPAAPQPAACRAATADAATLEPRVLVSSAGTGTGPEKASGDVAAGARCTAGGCEVKDLPSAEQRRQEEAAAVAVTAVSEDATPSPPPALSAPLPLPLPGGKLVCNEPDRQRLQRLQRVLDEYVPLTARGNVELLSHLGQSYWGRNQAACYDRVLVDAPCSSDRHVLQQAAATQRGAIGAADWSLAGCRRMADEQLQLCLAALRALRVGGRLVYSTCSIAPVQNDEVVDRLLRRLGPEVVRVLPALDVLRGAVAEAAGQRGAAAQAVAGPGDGEGADVVGVLGVEATRHGAICLPDRGGWGPIYVAVVEKAAAVAGGGAAALLRVQPMGGSDDEEEEEAEAAKETQDEVR